MPAHQKLIKRPRIAIISTYDEMCGIAGYTRALEKQLAPYADLTIFDLDQYLLRSKHGRIQRLGDQHIREIARALENFDSVNIQLEHGTLGRTSRQIIRRFRLLTNAAPALSVTFHTVMIADGMPFEVVGRLLATGKLPSAAKVIDMAIKGFAMSRAIQGSLRRLQRKKPVSAIVHSKRDMRLMRDLYQLENVYHHPLSFISRPEAQATRLSTCRADFPLIETLPTDAKLIGTFGFLSPYKGFESAIRALQFLPENYHLVIFGGIHPQSIKREEPLDPYILRLFRAARIGQTPLDHLKESGLSLSPGGDIQRLISEHPASLQGRVHFMGALSDAQFASAMALCDAAVFPYMEVGQSSSGPISIALEMGTRVIASRTAAFRAYSRYHPDMVEFFDIGNYAELATRIMARNKTGGKIPELAYNTITNARTYLQASGSTPELVDSDMEINRHEAA
jgi:glycosyltransferase involved in cell wall biosynthesis